MTKKDQARQELRDQLNALTMEALDFDACECINPSDLDDGIDHVIEALEEHINESSDIIYYSRAIEFLSENDPSLRRSLELAGEFGYKPEDLDSEKLATILNIEEKRNALRKIRDEIEEIIDEREELNEEERDTEEIIDEKIEDLEEKTAERIENEEKITQTMLNNAEKGGNFLKTLDEIIEKLDKANEILKN